MMPVTEMRRYSGALRKRGLGLKPIGRYNGRPVYRLSYRVVQQYPLGRVDDWVDPQVVEEGTMVAHSARDVVDALRAEWGAWADMTIRAWGPLGGVVEHHVSAYSAISRGIIGAREAPQQLPL